MLDYKFNVCWAWEIVEHVCNKRWWQVTKTSWGNLIVQLIPRGSFRWHDNCFSSEKPTQKNLFLKGLLDGVLVYMMLFWKTSLSFRQRWWQQIILRRPLYLQHKLLLLPWHQKPGMMELNQRPTVTDIIRPSLLMLQTYLMEDKIFYSLHLLSTCLFLNRYFS